MRLGIVNQETWDFLHELYAHLAAVHQTSVFAPPAPLRAPFMRERIARHRRDRALRAFLGRHDVVFFEWASELLAHATRLPKTCAIVTRLHRYELYAWADRINWDAVDRVILVSEAKRREFIARFPGHAGKTHVVPVGISLERYQAVDRVFSGAIGTLCHLTPRKRVYDLILAFADLLKSVPALRLRVAGDVEPAHLDYHEALQRLVRQLGIEAHVRFDGAIAKPWTWYPQIDIFISHSYSEGLQVAPMEAMATGCHTLSHAWDGADELVPPDCLYLSDAELVQKVEAFCNASEGERAGQRRRMRALAEDRFDARRTSERIAEIVEGCG
jgi:glycosyltransferase involved in cell wall biosynthesis